jgi:hypothetical protein
MRKAKGVTSMGEMRNGYKILVGKTAGKRLLVRTRRTEDGNTTMGLKYIRRGNADWIQLAHGEFQLRAIVNTVMNHELSRKAENFLNR